MSDKKKPGPKSPWDESLGNGVHIARRIPIAAWEIFDNSKTKDLLNAMVMDENIRQKVWAIGQEWKKKSP